MNELKQFKGITRLVNIEEMNEILNESDGYCPVVQ